MFTCVQSPCVKSGPHGRALEKYKHASQALEHVNQICPTSFQHATGVWACGNRHPWDVVVKAQVFTGGHAGSLYYTLYCCYCVQVRFQVHGFASQGPGVVLLLLHTGKVSGTQDSAVKAQVLAGGHAGSLFCTHCCCCAQVK